jgi:enoyl-CoA hydratase
VVENYTVLTYEKSGHVAWITLNRPEIKNALNNTSRPEISDALLKAQIDSDVYVIVLTGSGDKIFCAGGDINQQTTVNSVDQLQRHGARHPTYVIREITKPVVAMVNGAAVGGGCEMVMSCDLAIASETARFGFPEITIGLIPGTGATQILPRLLGEKRAKELIFTGRLFSAQEALQMGLVNLVAPPDKLRETTEGVINTLLKRSPATLRIAKLAVNRAFETTLSAGLATERDLYAFCFGTDDQKEGARAFLNKTEPQYRGK